MLATIRNIGRGAESVVECKQVFHRVDGCCCSSVHVPTSFCRREIRPVVLGDEKRQSVFFMMSPRECFVLSCKTVEHRSRKSRDLLKTDEFMVTDLFFVVTAFSVVACVLLHAHQSLRTAQGGITLLNVVSENIPSWHGLCLSCMVIASAAILLLC